MRTLRLLVWAGATVGLSGLFSACGSGSGDDGETGGSGASGGSSGNASGGGGATGGTGLGKGGAFTTGGFGNMGGESGGGGEGGEDGCATTTQKAELTTANLLFVVDKSGSMNCNPPEGDQQLNARCATFPIKEDMSLPSKWEVTTDALANALDTLAEQPNVRAGLSLFPKDSGKCDVEVDPEVDIAQLNASHRSDIASLLDGVAPLGDTPLAGATILSYAHLSDAIRAGNVEGNTFVVLLTDGAETCKVDELSKLIDTDVPNARLWNIRTFVIGVPGSEQARSLLSEMAFVGGTASSTNCSHGSSQDDEGDCHFDMTESTNLAEDLNAALQEISRDRILSCEYDIPENPDGGGVDLNKVNVTFTAGDGMEEQIPKDETGEPCATASGWQYSPDVTKIELCGEVCERVKADPEGQVRIVLGCPTIVVR